MRDGQEVYGGWRKGYNNGGVPLEHLRAGPPLRPGGTPPLASRFLTHPGSRACCAGRPNCPARSRSQRLQWDQPDR